MQHTNSLKVDTSVKGILLLTLPISVARLIPELNYLINAGFLGSLGTHILSLVGVTGVYYLIFAALGYGLNNALISLMSRKAGEDDRSDIFTILWHGLFISLILATVFIGFTYFVLDDLLNLIGVSQNDRSFIIPFLKIRIWGLLFLFVLQMQSAYLISLQQTKFLMIVALVEAIINFVLDYTLIFGHFGFPALGFNGAAYASVIAEAMGALIIICVIYYSKLSTTYNIPIKTKIAFTSLKTVFIQSLPLMCQYAISTGAWWIFYILINRNYPVNDQAVSQMMRNLFGLGGVFSWAFGASTNTIISNLIGQNKQTLIKKTVWNICLISVSGMVFFLSILNLFPTLFFGMFGDGASLISDGLSTLHIVSIAMVILCIGVIWLNAVVATGYTNFVFWIEFCGIFCYLVYVFTVIEYFNFPLEVAWMSEWIYWSVILILSLIFMYTHSKTKIISL